MSALENTPEDVKHLIIENISDISSFESLVDTSPSFKELYKSNPRYFLMRLLRRAVHKDIQREALISFQSSMMMHVGDTRIRKAIDFLSARYGEKEWDPLSTSPVIKLPPLIPKNIDKVALNLILELHRTVQFLTTDFCSYIAKSHCHKKRPQIRFSLPLSESETCRIQRAFYRIETFSNLFSTKTCHTEARFYVDRFQVSWVRDRDPGKPLNQWQEHEDSYYSEDKALFCKSFPAWENEEIACIREYMRARIGEGFAAVGPDYNREDCLESRGPEQWQYDLSPEKNLLEDAKGTGFHIDNQIMQGLRHFEKLLKSTNKNELTNLIERNLYRSTRYNGLATALAAERDRDVIDIWHDSLSLDEILYDDYSSPIRQIREKFRFKGDNDYLTSPNLGYANHVKKVESDVLQWSAYYYDTLWNRDDGMRARGYALWDEARFAEFDSQKWFGHCRFPLFDD